MLITKIRCLACGNEGEIEIIGLPPGADPDRLFVYLGNHEFTDNMFFRCPRCKWELLVNPMELLGPGMINGVPLYRKEAPEHTGSELESTASLFSMNKSERGTGHVCTEKNSCCN